MSKFDRIQLGDVVDLLTGFPFKSADYTDASDGIRLVRGDNIVQGGFRWDGVKRWPADATKQFTKVMLQQGDVVVAMDRPWIEAGLKYAVVRETDCPALLVQRVARLRATERIDPSYLKCVVASKGFTNYILAVQTGTAVPHISARQIASYEFDLPDLATQKLIGQLIGALDDKIELNRRMNETLEAQARALFRDWFVDFGPVKAKMAGAAPYLAPDLWCLFPDRLGNDGVPNGWLVYNVCDLAEHHTASLNPQSFPDEEFEHFSLPAFDSGRDPTTEQGSNIKSNKTIVPDRAVLLSKLNPEIARVWLPASSNGSRQIASTEFLAFVPKDGASRSLIYSLFSDPQFRQRLEGMVTGTSKSHQRVNPKALSALEAFSGEPEVMRAFASIADPWMDKVVQNRIESAILAHTRDLLLPKLMSGDIRVGDVERELEPA